MKWNRKLCRGKYPTSGLDEPRRHSRSPRCRRSSEPKQYMLPHSSAQVAQGYWTGRWPSDPFPLSVPSFGHLHAPSSFELHSSPRLPAQDKIAELRSCSGLVSYACKARYGAQGRMARAPSLKGYEALRFTIVLVGRLRRVLILQPVSTSALAFPFAL